MDAESDSDLSLPRSRADHVTALLRRDRLDRRDHRARRDRQVKSAVGHRATGTGWGALGEEGGRGRWRVAKRGLCGVYDPLLRQSTKFAARSLPRDGDSPL
jgi:hypothetical protein